MAKARALDKRRKSIRNIRKITRTMELIATARSRRRWTGPPRPRPTRSGSRSSSPTWPRPAWKSAIRCSKPHDEDRRTRRCWCSRPIAACAAATTAACSARRWPGYEELQGRRAARCTLEVSGKRGIAAFKFRKITLDQTYTQFDDKPQFDEVEPIANRYLEALRHRQARPARRGLHEVPQQQQADGRRRDAAAAGLAGRRRSEAKSKTSQRASRCTSSCRRPQSILEEVVPASFKVKLFKCFLDAAVSEQIARMVAMKSATENADEMIKELSSDYNRARQGQITGEIMEIIGGVEALKG